MSPVHVRRIRTTAKRLTLDRDEVIWVGPGSHSLTEIHALGSPKDQAVAFLPTAKNFSDFGVAQLAIGPNGGEIEEPGWQIFKNGLDPAPVATGAFCGDRFVLYARPTDARPYSPQELHLALVSGRILPEGEVIARSRAYNNLSVAPRATGALAVWTADKRTWAMTLACPRR
jgi:hypothetical protein